MLSTDVCSFEKMNEARNASYLVTYNGFYSYIIKLEQCLFAFNKSGALTHLQHYSTDRQQKMYKTVFIVLCRVSTCFCVLIIQNVVLLVVEHFTEKNSVWAL
jgi:hypothetical protein